MTYYKTVVWATDGSSGADAALEEAVTLAQSDGAHLIAVHCDQRLNGRAGSWPAIANEDDVRARIGDQVAELRRSGIDIELIVRHSHREAADVVAAIAAERGADLIVCGTHGRGAFGSFLVGSFTQRLLHVAPCPVLTVREREAVKEPDLAALVTSP
jgi:nucleotide-binding universal stress UspA family protein